MYYKMINMNCIKKITVGVIILLLITTIGTGLSVKTGKTLKKNFGSQKPASQNNDFIASLAILGDDSEVTCAVETVISEDDQIYLNESVSSLFDTFIGFHTGSTTETDLETQVKQTVNDLNDIILKESEEKINAEYLLGLLKRRGLPFKPIASFGYGISTIIFHDFLLGIRLFRPFILFYPILGISGGMFTKLIPPHVALNIRAGTHLILVYGGFMGIYINFGRIGSNSPPLIMALGASLGALLLPP